MRRIARSGPKRKVGNGYMGDGFASRREAVAPPRRPVATLNRAAPLPRL
jgi:hypothetical protein